jgi:hypothetical protein
LIELRLKVLKILPFTSVVKFEIFLEQELTEAKHLVQMTLPFHKKISAILNSKKSSNEHSDETFKQVLEIVHFEEMHNLPYAPSVDTTEGDVRSAMSLVTFIAGKYPHCFGDVSIIRLILELFPFFAHPFEPATHEQGKSTILVLFKMFYSRDLERFRVAFDEHVQMLKGNINII